MGVERLDQLGEVGERSGQPIDLIDDDDVDPSGLHIDEQFLQSRPIHRAAGKAAIVITVPDQPPALVSLAPDVCLFPQLLEEGEVVESATIWESSRICAVAAPGRPERSKNGVGYVLSELIEGIGEVALMAGARGVLSAAPRSRNSRRTSKLRGVFRRVLPPSPSFS